MRIETDSIGQLEIPEDVYYGIQTYRAVLNFQISGTKIHKEMLSSYLLLKKAAAIANRQTQKLSNQKAEIIINAIDSILKEDYEKYFIIDTFQSGAGTSQNMNANEVIANYANAMCGGKLGEYQYIKPNDDVNMSQSTNDTYPSAMQLSVLQLSKKLMKELELLVKTFKTKSEDFKDINKCGRTHLQDAIPISLGKEFETYGVIIEQLITVLKQSQSQLKDLGIGGSAIGTGINVPKGFREEILKKLKIYFNDEDLILSDDMCASMQSQLPIAIYSNWLKLFALEFTKILNDLRLMCSGPQNGFSEINLPKIQPGSSIMPGKINPSLLEMGNQVCFKVLGNDTAMAYAIQAGQLELNVMMPLMAHLTLESSELLIQAIKAIREKCINGISANIERCSLEAVQSSVEATLLSPIIGHQKAAELVNEALSTKTNIIELIKSKKILNSEQINSLFNY